MTRRALAKPQPLGAILCHNPVGFPGATRTQGRPAGPVAQTFQSAGCGDFPVPTFGPRNWKVPRTRRLESLRYEADAPANPGLEDAAPSGQRAATRIGRSSETTRPSH